MFDIRLHVVAGVIVAGKGLGPFVGHQLAAVNPTPIAAVNPTPIAAVKNTIRDFTLSFTFKRIIDFFLAPAVLTNWFMKICSLVEDRNQVSCSLVEDRNQVSVADPELVNWYQNWQRLQNTSPLVKRRTYPDRNL